MRISYCGLLALLGASLALQSVQAQTPVISSMGNGKLTFTNVNPNLEYRVEWSSTPSSNNVHATYTALEFITPTSSVAMTVELPLYLRLSSTNPLPAGIYRMSDTPLNLNVGTNKKVTLEWAETAEGPWQTSWTPPTNATVTGAWMNVISPNYVRIHYINCPSNYAGCAAWSNATAAGANRTISFGFGNYMPPCLQVRVGQAVTFTAYPLESFSSSPLDPACQECATITNLNFGTSQAFVFTKPGYYGYYSSPHSDPDGSGMAGNIRVVP